jgi:radical SAM protein with 4Fe4S-binding SPASM domain
VHCGSRAGQARADELSTEEALRVVRQLAAMGCERLTLSGGEPTMRADWAQLAAEATAHGVYCNMISNGAYSASRAVEVARKALASGMGNIGVSIDGTKDTHDALRGRNSFDLVISSAKTFMEQGLKVAVLTSVSKPNLAELDAIHDLLAELGVSIWRLQLTVPMGNMSAHRDLLLEPRQILDLMPKLAGIQKRSRMHVMLSDSVGYYGPYDAALRGTKQKRGKTCWQGCQAGMRVLGIEADGDVKGCLSLQADGAERWVEGNLRTQSLEEIWNRPGAFAYNREFELEDLTGACSACRYAAMCKGGSRCTSAAVLGVMTEDPFCYHAQDELRRRRHGFRPAATAAAAAALLMAAAPLGCDSDSEVKYGLPQDDVELSDVADTDAEQDQQVDVQPPYGLPDDFGDSQQKYGVPEDFEDVQPPYSVPDEYEDVEPPYSLPPDEDPEVDERYGLPPDP